MNHETEVMDGADRAPEISQHIGYLLRRAQQAHVAVWQSEVSKEVTSVQFGVLSVLARTPGASQTELCAQLDLDRSTIADIVARLERRGLIERCERFLTFAQSHQPPGEILDEQRRQRYVEGADPPGFLSC